MANNINAAPAGRPAIMIDADVIAAVIDDPGTRQTGVFDGNGKRVRLLEKDDFMSAIDIVIQMAGAGRNLCSFPLRRPHPAAEGYELRNNSYLDPARLHFLLLSESDADELMNARIYGPGYEAGIDSGESSLLIIRDVENQIGGQTLLDPAKIKQVEASQSQTNAIFGHGADNRATFVFPAGLPVYIAEDIFKNDPALRGPADFQKAWDEALERGQAEADRQDEEQKILRGDFTRMLVAAAPQLRKIKSIGSDAFYIDPACVQSAILFDQEEHPQISLLYAKIFDPGPSPHHKTLHFESGDMARQAYSVLLQAGVRPESPAPTADPSRPAGP